MTQESKITVIELLFKICGVKNLEAAKNVLKTIDINIPDPIHGPLLHLAIAERNLELVTLFLSSGASANLKYKGEFPLHIASECGFLEIVQLLIKYNSNVNLRNVAGMTPLFLAVRENHLEVAKVLLESKADVDYPTNTTRTPLMEASRAGHVSLVKLLLDYKAKLDLVDRSNMTALNEALYSPEIVELLLKNGADSSIYNKDEEILLQRASACKVTEVVRLLIRYV